MAEKLSTISLNFQKILRKILLSYVIFNYGTFNGNTLRKVLSGFN